MFRRRRIRRHMPMHYQSKYFYRFKYNFPAAYDVAVRRVPAIDNGAISPKSKSLQSAHDMRRMPNSGAAA